MNSHVIVAAAGNTLQARLYKGSVTGSTRVFQIIQSGASKGARKSVTTTTVDVSADFAAGESALVRVNSVAGGVVYGSVHGYLECEALE